jgi:membrane associated rhomboid family serine protease
MGIYDRDYYRREGPSILGAFTSTGQVCKWLLLGNILVFVLQTLSAPRGQASPITDWFILDTSKVFSGEVWRLLTYSFLHAGILHIVFNMLFLWWFGSETEGIYGPKEFLTFYLVAALLGGIAYTGYAGVLSYQATGSPSAIPMGCLGASGAVTAVMVLFACHYPQRTIYLLFVLPVPMWVFVGLMIFFDTFTFVSGLPTDTAVVVHLAGAAFGFGYYKLQCRLSPWWSWLLTARSGLRSRPRLRVYHGEEGPVEALTAPPNANATRHAGDVDEQLEAKLDAVLEKVARSGQASLNESEREILFRASEIYKKRRS